jgi:hypothetical protein
LLSSAAPELRLCLVGIRYRNDSRVKSTSDVIATTSADVVYTRKATEHYSKEDLKMLDQDGESEKVDDGFADIETTTTTATTALPPPKRYCCLSMHDRAIEAMSKFHIDKGIFRLAVLIPDPFKTVEPPVSAPDSCYVYGLNECVAMGILPEELSGQVRHCFPRST